MDARLPETVDGLFFASNEKARKRIIEYIQRNHIVLTEHVGDLSKSKAIDDILR